MNTKAMNPKAMNTESLTEDDALTEASARLQTLILRRAEGNSRLQKRLRRDMRQASFALPPRPAYKARLLQAALVIVKSVYAYSWEDLQAILDNRAGRDTSLREAVRRQEADRLLVQRLMTAERKLDFVRKLAGRHTRPSTHRGDAANVEPGRPGPAGGGPAHAAPRRHSLCRAGAGRTLLRLAVRRRMANHRHAERHPPKRLATKAPSADN